MRVISGDARGTRLITLEGKETRPTLDRVKESLFSIIQHNIRDANVLDLFAGSGALGIESISRGATSVTFCDKSSDAINIINKNLEKIKINKDVSIINSDYIRSIKKIKR